MGPGNKPESRGKKDSWPEGKCGRGIRGGKTSAERRCTSLASQVVGLGEVTGKWTPGVFSWQVWVGETFLEDYLEISVDTETVLPCNNVL